MRLRFVSFIAFLSLLLLASCGMPSGQIRLKGTYANIKQGDFYLISTDGGLDRLDTLHIIGGEFEYECDLGKEATFYIIYPNNSQLVVWAQGGDDIRVKGDVQDLWNAEVKGNSDNELYTEFRQHNQANDTTALRKAAATLIRQHPASRVAPYLLCQYFILPDGVPRDSTERLYDVILEAQPQAPDVVKLGGLIQQRYILMEGAMMPAFDLVTTDSVHHTLARYKGKDLVLYFWAGWQGSTGYTHQQLDQLRTDLSQPADGAGRARDINLLGYSLDMDTLTLQANRPAEGLNIATYCDFQGFNSKFINLIGLRSVPLFVIVGPDGKIKRVVDDVNKVKKYYN